MHRFLIRLLAAATVLLVAAPATAQFTRDKAAQKKIEEAINQHYFGTDFEKAEGVLTGTIKACEDKCSPQTLAKAWMYVGIVRGSGKQDHNGAREAFMNAIALDPQVTLDEAIASPETKTVWGEITGSAVAPPTPPPVADGGTPDGGTRPRGRKVAGNMECTLEATEIQKRYPVEFACSTEEEATEAELRYKPFGSEKWEKKKMRKKGDYFIAQIPCDATMDAGDLKIYIRASGEEGIVDQWGKKSEPVVLKVVNKTDQEVPSLPDKDPPDRCAEKVECPPDFPGCGKGGGAKRGDKPWGSACEADIECQQGLACVNGSCEEGQSCEVDEDCAGGSCVGGTCAGGVGGGGDTGPKGPYKKIWVGLHVAQDLAIVGGDEVCSQASQANEGFACFFTDESGQLVQYGFDPQPGFANKINTGLAPGTTRFLLSGDYALTDRIMVGARLGYAIGGGPATVDAANNEIKFLPIHAEARGSFWFSRVPGKGLHPYVHVGAGMAQVDAKLPVTIRDCSRLSGVDIPPDDPRYQNCVNASSGGSIQPHDPLELDAYKKLGQGFGTLGGGAVFGLTDTLGVQLNLNLMFMMPTSGIVIEPSLGGVYGF